MAAQLGFQGREFIGVDELVLNEPAAEVLDEVQREHPPAVSEGIDLCDRVAPNVFQAMVAQQPGYASSDEQIDAVRVRVRLENGVEPIPRFEWGVSCVERPHRLPPRLGRG